ncbi:MAG: hypothetical protein PHV85_02860 [Desulfovibrionaceae bacterium]|nr:hypothetical protein [Desulfovibrionaceae bacterium]MDD4951471.1 hypothetical protein [Desulfovibrionaceae bacterium]
MKQALLYVGLVAVLCVTAWMAGRTDTAAVARGHAPGMALVRDLPSLALAR